MKTLCIVWAGTTPLHGIHAVVVGDAREILNQLRWQSSLKDFTVYDSNGNTVKLGHDGKVYRSPA